MTLSQDLQPLFETHQVSEFRWLDPREIVVAEWVRMKCRFGCKHHGKAATCPPHTPSVSECERFFQGYRHAAIFEFRNAFQNPEDRHRWTRQINGRLLQLERAVFLAGYPKAFVLFIDPCNLCIECTPHPADCRHPQHARPAPEALAVDVFSTATKCGYAIQVLTDYSQEMHRFGFLLVE